MSVNNDYTLDPKIIDAISVAEGADSRFKIGALIEITSVTLTVNTVVPLPLEPSNLVYLYWKHGLTLDAGKTHWRVPVACRYASILQLDVTPHVTVDAFFNVQITSPQAGATYNFYVPSGSAHQHFSVAAPIDEYDPATDTVGIGVEIAAHGAELVLFDCYFSVQYVGQATGLT